MPTTDDVPSTVKAIEVFCAYSHRDEALRDELETHLGALKRSGLIAVWHDRRISGGREWTDEISIHLNRADLILLLVSSDFIASDYCYEKEVTRAMERHQLRDARVVPVILRDCDWGFTKFSKLQALPKDGMPVLAWTRRDEAFKDVAIGIRRIAEELGQRASRPRKDGTALLPATPRLASLAREFTSPVHNPRDLLLYGPRLKIKFGPPILRGSQSPPAGSAHEQASYFLVTDALVDPGAGRSVMTPDAVRRAGLTKIDETTVLGVGGTLKADVYAASLQFPDSALSPIEVISILCCELPHPLFNCLIGRDVLARWVLTYDGPVGTWHIIDQAIYTSVEPPEGVDPGPWSR
jgi:hypothetical protein